ncbi:MAG: hypothetical protein M1823_004361 [Watsoniomyces obsoletus]|nr:MAG: hypothetical protein M1823_004361 [Watsoniomyces obsoletus]
MEEVHARHQKERRDLQSRITQKKKAATKKTRSGINAECEVLERDLREKQDRELAEHNDAPGTAPEDDGQELANDVSLLDIDEKNDDSAHIPESGASEDARQASKPENESATVRKPNRQKARLARRAAVLEAQATEAAEEAAKVPNLREKERVDMADAMQQHGRAEKDIRPDGHCLYAAVADQLAQAGLGVQPNRDGVSSANQNSEENLPGYRRVRQAAADYIRGHPDDFAPFLEEPLERYTHKIKDTAEWGGHLELMAIAQAYGVSIKVLQGDGRLETIAPDDGNSIDGSTLWLAYYRHHYGLGEHYNSLRPIAGPDHNRKLGNVPSED